MNIPDELDFLETPSREGITPPIQSSGSCGRWTLFRRTDGMTIPFLCCRGRCTNPECRSRWAGKRIATICAVQWEYSLDKFFTLTIDASMMTLEVAWSYIQTIWKRFRHRMKRKCHKAGLDFKFIAVLERHKNGWPHIHGFTSFWMHQREWSRMWDECGGGKVVWVEQVDNQGAANYVGKYVGKNNVLGALEFMAKGAKTMWRSKNTRSQFERERINLTSECDPDYTKVWSLVKETVHGQEKQQGQDMEGTCQPVPEVCADESGIILEAKEGACSTCQEDFDFESAEREDKPRDQEDQGDVEHGDKKERHEVNTSSVQSREERVPCDTLQSTLSRYRFQWDRNG